MSEIWFWMTKEIAQILLFILALLVLFCIGYLITVINDFKNKDKK